MCQHKNTPGQNDHSKDTDSDGSEFAADALNERREFEKSFVEDENRLVKLLEESRVNPNDEIPRPPVCLTIETGNEQSILATLGNFSLAIGKAKSRKTFFVGIAIAAAASQKEIFDKIQGHLPSHQNVVLYFDTEQSKYHVLRSVQRICSILNLNDPGNLQTYSLRKFPPADRLSLIQTAIYSTPSVAFVVIDGIRDLITSINDEEQATDMSSLLLKWTEELNIHILCVLHQNKGDNNARGHLGTELQNKAETVLSITKDTDKNISVVEAELCRDKDFEPFGFEIDEHGLPRIVESWRLKEKGAATKKSIVPNDILAVTHEQVLRKVFAKCPQPTYKELWAQIMLAFNDEGQRFGENKAKLFLAWYTAEGYVIKPENANTRRSYYSLNPEKVKQV